MRKVLSGGDAKDDFAGSPADTEGAEDQLRFPRFGALLRLPAQAVAVSPDSAGERDIPALGGDVAPRDDKIDITEVLTALKNAGRALDDRHAMPAGDGAKNAEAGSDQEGSDSNGRGLALAAELLAAGNGLPNQIDQGRTARDAAALPAPPAAPLGMQAGRASARTAADHDLHFATRADAAQPALKATVVHQATHFAPALGATNIQAISSAITEMASDTREGTTRSAPDPAAHQAGVRSGGPVQTLTIQLTPISLGKVTVEMRIVGGAMTVDIQVAEPRALELVRADKDLIMALVRKTGVMPDTVTIQSAENASAMKQNPNGQGGANGSGFDRESSRDGAGRSSSEGRNETEDGGISHDERRIGEVHLRGDIYV